MKPRALGYARWFAALFGFTIFALVLSSCRSDRLVDVQTTVPGIVLDIRYATTNNFTGQKLYPFSRCFLRRAAAEKLRAAQAELATMGYGLKIYDGYRPLSVQRKMWEVYPNPGYVADPKKGSRHNRGAAVDVTLIRLVDGADLPMPTPYDDFTVKAHRGCRDLPEDVVRNRQLLEQVLTKHGFVGLPTEWWHFDDQDWQKYPILDVDIPDRP